MGPAGTVHCSISDLARFGAFHLRRGKLHNGKRLLRDETMSHLHGANNKDDKWGLGLVKADRKWAGGIALTHAGTNTSNYAVIWLAPQKDFGAIVVTNQGGDKASATTDKIVGKLIERYLTAAKAP